MIPNLDTRFVQIMPAPAGWVVWTYDDCGNQKSVRVQFIALDAGGSIWFLYPEDGSLGHSLKAHFIG